MGLQLQIWGSVGFGLWCSFSRFLFVMITYI
jgi:hypothetical protein